MKSREVTGEVLPEKQENLSDINPHGIYHSEQFSENIPTGLKALPITKGSQPKFRPKKKIIKKITCKSPGMGGYIGEEEYKDVLRSLSKDIKGYANQLGIEEERLLLDFVQYWKIEHMPRSLFYQVEDQPFFQGEEHITYIEQDPTQEYADKGEREEITKPKKELKWKEIEKKLSEERKKPSLEDLVRIIENLDESERKKLYKQLGVIKFRGGRRFTTELTERQRRVLQYIKDYMDRHHRSPSIPQICKDLGFSSTTSAAKYLTVLEKKGYIRRGPPIPGTPGNRREIEIIRMD